MKKQPNEYIATTIRVPEKLLDEIKAISEEIGDSQNGTMLHLIYFGLKTYKSQFNLCALPDTRSEIPQ